MENKHYKNFYESYKKKLKEQYPTVAKTGVDISPVSPFLLPFSQSKVDEIKVLVHLFYSMAHRPKYAELIKSDQSVYLHTPTSSALLMSYDFHVNAEGDLKLIEVNTNSSGYLVATLVDQVHGLNSKESLLTLKKSFEEEWKNFSGKNSPPSNLLIMDYEIKSQKMYIEFLMYQDLLHSWDWPAKLEEIENLKISPEKVLLDSEQKEVQMIYNRSTDFYFEKTPLFKEAFLKQLCCISPHPKEYLLLADKMRLCEWSSSQFLEALGLSEKNKETIKKVVPKTALLNSLSKEELWKKRKEFFFKPLRGYGGKSVYRGKGISHKVFERLLTEPSLFQEFVPPALFTDPSGIKWKYDIRAYVYRDQVQKLIARIYHGQLTQFHIPLSGFASLDIK